MKGKTKMTDAVNITTGELVVASDEGVREAIAALNSGTAAIYSSIQGTDFASRKIVLKAVTSSKPISENLNKEIKLANVVVQQVEMPNEDEGGYTSVPRVVFIDDKGNAYHAISGVLFRDLETLLGVMGQPSAWDEPVTVKVVQGGSGNRKFFTLEIV